MKPRNFWTQTFLILFHWFAFQSHFCSFLKSTEKHRRRDTLKALQRDRDIAVDWGGIGLNIFASIFMQNDADKYVEDQHQRNVRRSKSLDAMVHNTIM